MKKLAVLLMKEPYGAINAAEAVRHALGAVSEDMEISFVLAEAGVCLAAKGQEVGETGFMNLGESLSDCVDMDIAVYADRGSLKQARLGPDEITEGVKVVEAEEISAILRDADQTLIY